MGVGGYHSNGLRVYFEKGTIERIACVLLGNREDCTADQMLENIMADLLGA